MSQFEVLNKDKHRQLRIKTGYGAALGDAVMYVMTYPMEFRDIQSCYPILFTKDPNTGGFFAAAVMGFETDQNLFLQDDGWDASYIPAAAQRQPFLIATGGEGDDRPAVVSLDLDNPRVSQDDGEALFDSDGDPTDFLNQKIALLCNTAADSSTRCCSMSCWNRSPWISPLMMAARRVFRVFTVLPRNGSIS
jgi:hypothetical protein